METLSSTISLCGHGYLDSSGTLQQFWWMVPVSSLQQTPHRCPVCNGTGMVSAGFYSRASDQPTSTAYSTVPETCRSCDGKGVLWR